MNKQDFYNRQKLEIKTYYRRLRDEGKTRTQALEVLKAKYEYSHSTLKQIMFDKNYRKLATTRDLETNNRAKEMHVEYTAA